MIEKRLFLNSKFYVIITIGVTAITTALFYPHLKIELLFIALVLLIISNIIHCISDERRLDVYEIALGKIVKKEKVYAEDEEDDHYFIDISYEHKGNKYVEKLTVTQGDTSPINNQIKIFISPIDGEIAHIDLNSKNFRNKIMVAIGFLFIDICTAVVMLGPLYL